MSISGSNTPGQWYVTHNNQRYGPYTPDVLADWIAVGRIDAAALVSDGGPWISTAQFIRKRAQEHVATAPATGAVMDVDEEMISPAAPDKKKDSSDSTHVGAVIPPAAPPAPPPSLPATKPAPSPARATVATEREDDGPPDRDRIVIIGRRQSGKTIFLATIYARLWKSLNGMSAKALSGEVHRQLMNAHHALTNGEWPAATLGTSHMEMELEYAGKKRLVVTLDYAGELFRKAFVEEQSDFAGVKDLVSHIDRAAAVVLLVDPSVAAGMDHEAAMDDDFGLVQAVQRIRNWPDGHNVPVVLVLTKMDQYQGLLDRFGSAKDFVRGHFPALVRLLKQIPIFQISAVQVEKGADGLLRPRADSQPINIDAPLRYCLQSMDQAHEKAQQKEQEQQRRAMEKRLEREQIEKERRQNRMVMLAVILIILLGVIAATLILIYKV
jgi:hypothetical protein